VTQRLRPKERQAGEPGAGPERMLGLVQRGIRGEQSVARALRRLLRARPYFYVINALPLRRGDIDHIVVGPTGVFAIETKGYTGKITIADGALARNGFHPDRDPLRQARRAAATVRERLQRSGFRLRRVQPVLCLPYALLDRPQCVRGVLLTRREHLGHLLRRWEGQELDEAQAARVFTVLRRHAQFSAA
jgi:hypothetical protein